jgi:hypothetical protein
MACNVLLEVEGGESVELEASGVEMRDSYVAIRDVECPEMLVGSVNYNVKDNTMFISDDSPVSVLVL